MSQRNSGHLDEPAAWRRLGEVINDAFLARLAFAARLSKNTESPIETMMGFRRTGRISAIRKPHSTRVRQFRHAVLLDIKIPTLSHA